MADKKVASQILDYWFAIEFLGQDSYDKCTEESKLTRELEKYKKLNKSDKNRRKQISIFERLDGNKDIYDVIADQAKTCNMFTWGNLTFFLGKIKRQTCIEKLANELGVKLEQAEKNTDFIPVLSFQCSNVGVYIEHSLSLSTIVWALSQMSGKKNAQISEILSEKAYLDTLEELEEKFFNLGSNGSGETNGKTDASAGDESNISVNTGESYANDIQTGISVFDETSISIERIKKIFAELIKGYEKYIGDGSIETYNGIKYQLFKDSGAKDKYDDNNYMGLSHNFFSSDLKMVKDDIEKEKFDFSADMLTDLISYICAPYTFKCKEKFTYGYESVLFAQACICII